MLVIAHRLSTVEKAHNIIVLDKGRVVQQGSHKELMEEGGLYSKLVQRQILGPEGSGADSRQPAARGDAVKVPGGLEEEFRIDHSLPAVAQDDYNNTAHKWERRRPALETLAGTPRQEAAWRRARALQNAARLLTPRASHTRAHTNTHYRASCITVQQADAGWLNREMDLFEGVGSSAIPRVSTGFLFVLPVIPLDWDFSPIDMHV